MTSLSHDWEWASGTDIAFGLDRYFADPQSRPLMCAYRFDDEPIKLWDCATGEPFPREVDEAILDPHVTKFGFNSIFERLASQHRLKRHIPPAGWRCTMAAAYLRSFTGKLHEVGAQIGLPADTVKMKEGKRLVELFTQPQRVTKKNPHVWRDWTTDPADWSLFGDYCKQDVVAEDAIRRWLEPYTIDDSEWRLFEIDQEINQRGLPIDLPFVRNAIALSDRRKGELMDEMRRLTGVDNPNSTAQLLPWLRERGYPYDDLKADTVKKVIRETE